MELTQLCIYLEGVVQGVGMRYYVNDLARKMGITGYVQNTSDGRVKCIAQGDGPRLDGFVAAMRNAPRGRVTHVAVETQKLGELFADFSIRF